MLESTVLGRLFEHINHFHEDTGAIDIAANTRNQRVKEMNNDRVKTAERRLMSALRRVANAEIPLDLMSEYIKNLDTARKLSNRSRSNKSPKSFNKIDEIESLKYEDKRALLQENIKDIKVHKERVEVFF
jgi:hypothetical protein